MIPKIIHQTWKSDRLPGQYRTLAESWKAQNPNWEYRLWTDRDLVKFVDECHPGLFALFASYSNGVARADAARYMLLKTYGGVCADIDTECLRSLDDLVPEDRVVLCEEPLSHWSHYAPQRGHARVLFNGVMAGPAGHPFWDALLDHLGATRYANDVLDQTGPCFLTGVYGRFPDKASVRVEACHLFTPTDKYGASVLRHGADAPASYARHLWTGAGFGEHRAPPRPDPVAAFRRLRAELTRGPRLDPAAAVAAVDRKILARPRPSGDSMAVLVPVRDAAPDLEPFVEALARLDIDPRKTKLVFCEGDSADDTWPRLNAMLPALRERFREVVLTQCAVKTKISRANRSKARLQRARRAGLARVRNHLVDIGVTDDIDWALWIDVDVWKMPADLVARLKETGARIAVPHCVKHANGRTFDRNTFVDTGRHPARYYYKHMKRGLFMPPPDCVGLLYPDALRHSDRVEVDGVGGTVLLVDANVHRAGVRFPELPYRDHIETEGFGLLARDVGVRPVLLPRLEVFHTPW